MSVSRNGGGWSSMSTCNRLEYLYPTLNRLVQYSKSWEDNSAYWWNDPFWKIDWYLREQQYRLPKYTYYFFLNWWLSTSPDFADDTFTGELDFFNKYSETWKW